MDFSFTEEQEMLRTSARGFLGRECPKSKLRELEADERGYDPHTWRNMAELGWTGLALPEGYGGTGGQFMDLVVLLEEMGRNIFPSPFFSTVALCSLPILEFGSKGQKEDFLPKVASGEIILALALTESSARYEASEIRLRATPKGEAYILEGTKLFVNDANVAHYLLVVTRTSDPENPQEGITLFLVDAKSPGIDVEVIPTTASDKQCQVNFDKVSVPRHNILGEVNQGWEIVEFILQKATILKCAEMIGASQAVLEMANSYAKERVQFGRPIGSFQAIQHKLADMLIEVDGAKYLVYEAAWKISQGRPAMLEVSMAKAKASQVHQRACLDGIQIHGALGFSQDHDMGLYFRRVKAGEFALGDGDFHRERIAAELGL